MNYTWKIVAMDTAKNELGLTDVVKSIHYTVDCDDGTIDAEGNLISIGAYGSIGVGQPDQANFKLYDQLTEQEVIGWVKQGLDVAEVEAGLAKALEVKKNPPIIQKPNPWAN